MKTPSLYLTMVIWNNKDYLPDALASIEKQTDQDFGMIVVDNGSMDGGGEYLREKYPGVTMIRNNKNLGFSRAHNQAIALARAGAWALGRKVDDQIITALDTTTTTAVTWAYTSVHTVENSLLETVRQLDSANVANDGQRFCALTPHATLPMASAARTRTTNRFLIMLSSLKRSRRMPDRKRKPLEWLGTRVALRRAHELRKLAGKDL